MQYNTSKKFICFILIVFFITSILPDLSYAETFSELEHVKLLDDNANINAFSDSDKFKTFLDQDKEYLVSCKKAWSLLIKEIGTINKMIYNNKVNYRKSKKGVILYSPNTVGNIHVLKVAKQNRLDLMENRKTKGKKFVYNDKIIHFPQKSILGRYDASIDPDTLRIIYQEVENVVNNIEVDNMFFNNIIISVSPFKLKGIKGFTEIYGAHKNGITIVLSNDFKARNEDEQRIEVRKTLLHELGHVAHYKNTFTWEHQKNPNAEFWKEYTKFYDQQEFTYNVDTNSLSVEDWKNDQAENFAEDFMMYYSQKLGPYSFKAEEKRTNYEYNEKVGSFIEKSTKHKIYFHEPSIFDSQIVNDKFNLILDCCSTDEIDRDLADKLEINYKQNDGGSYIELWDVNQNFIKKVELKDSEGQFELDIDDNIGIIIKYVKIGNNYEAYWRRDFK